MRIAIVEDEIRIREGIHKLLSRSDSSFEIVGEAENGCEGVKLLLDKKPDLVLVDIRMPEMDGIAMLKEVHARGFKPMVIILSAYSDFSYAQQAMKLGAREYLVKPIIVDELIGAVRRAQETLSQQMLRQKGSRSRGDVLSSALYSDEVLPQDVRDYARHAFHMDDQMPFALLLVKIISQSEMDIGGQMMEFAGRYITGECTALSSMIQGCMPFIFTGFDENLEQTLEKKLFAVWKNDLRFAAQLGRCCGVDNLRKTALSMLSDMEYGLATPNGKLIRPDRSNQEMLSYPIETENAARRALAHHDLPGVQARIRDFGTFIENGKLYAPREIKEAHVRFVLALLNTAHDLGFRENISRQAILDRIMSAVHPCELADVRRELAESLRETPVSEGKTGLLVRRAKAMMKDYFAQGITLEEIAQKLSVTPEYLGSQIHREMGITFGALMKQLRVEEAKRLLLTTDKKLYEIARMVGYADAKYFSRVFQSIAGMLPAEYRRINK